MSTPQQIKPDCKELIAATKQLYHAAGSFNDALINSLPEFREDPDCDSAEDALHRALERASNLLGDVIDEATMPTLVDSLKSAMSDLLDIVKSELENDPEPDDLPSWKRAIEAAEKLL